MMVPLNKYNGVTDTFSSFRPPFQPPHLPFLGSLRRWLPLMVALSRSLLFRLPLVLLVAQLAASASVTTKTPAKRTYATHDYYVLQLRPSASSSIHDCAQELDVELVEQVGELANHWLVRVPAPASSDSANERRDVSNHDPVLERLSALRRTVSSSSSSSLHARSSHDFERRRSIARSIRNLDRQIPRQRTKKRAPLPELPSSSSSSDEESRAPVPPGGKSQLIAQELDIVDPIFNDQWHLANNPFPSFDLNVSGVWKEGITGKGVYTAVVDDGLDLNSDDLSANFYAEGSWDYNDHSPLPLPRLSDDQHGTRCSGEIAAVKNDVCGLGVAYESKIAGIRILSGPISDADEAAALNYGYNTTSVYSCSWGPPDDGRSMEAPSGLIKKAVLNGIQRGRGGKGSIFVFASGNGAASGDQCNFDGYTNSIYSVTVAAVDHKGEHPYYSEACAANLIVAYSSGGGNRIYTTDVGKDKCTSAHGGTSAAAPLGAGVITLGLQARPELTWRDVQYICIESAQHIQPHDPDWETTAVGRPYSYKYGYGALDAWTFVQLAKTWKLVKKQAWINVPQVEFADASITEEGVMTGGLFIGSSEGVRSSVEVSEEMMRENNFERLEHITVQVWISHSKRGDVEVDIVSPSGVKSVLAGARKYDDHTTGYPGWKFMSVKHWGENPAGNWTITVRDQQAEGHNGSFLGWTLMLWGECIDNDKAKLYLLPEDVAEDEVPTLATTTVSLASSTSTSATAKVKPTEGLPDDHDLADGDTSNPAFPQNPAAPSSSTSTITSSAASSPTSSPSPSPSSSSSVPPPPPELDEGYFDHIGDLMNSSTWLIVAFVLAAIFAIAGGLFFFQRRRARMRAAGGGEEVAMGSVDGASRRLLGGGGAGGAGGRRKGTRNAGELYDALGEVSDDDEDEEDDDYRDGHAGPSHGHVGLGYHDEFLDDDGPDSAAVSPRMGTYKDGQEHDGEGLPPREEEPAARTARTAELLDVSSPTGHSSAEGRSSSPSGGSGDSWEHASADTAR